VREAWHEHAVRPEMLLEQNTTGLCHRVCVCHSVLVEIVKVSLALSAGVLSFLVVCNLLNQPPCSLTAEAPRI
jgi:hypothetical protein